MELLTGKAREEFYKWYQNKHTEKINFKEYSLYLAKSISNSIMVEWFDSVGIYILVSRNSLIKKFYVNIDKLCYDIGTFETRQEATIAGIKKANEIFNSKF